jgi:hypothetical protein
VAESGCAERADDPRKARLTVRRRLGLGGGERFLAMFLGQMNPKVTGQQLRIHVPFLLPCAVQCGTINKIPLFCGTYYYA